MQIVDTDVIIVLVRIFFPELQSKITDIDVWVAVDMSRHFQFLPYQQHLSASW